jgi:PKD repeat protein
MKKQIFIGISIILLVSLSNLTLAQSLMITDTLKTCKREDPKKLDDYLINGLNQVKWEGQGVVQIGNSFYFEVLRVAPGIYELMVSATQNGNSVSDTLTVMVLKTPEVYAGKYDSVCVDGLEFSLNKNSPKGKTGAWYYQGIDRTRWDSVSNGFNPNAYGVSKHFFAYVYTVPNTTCGDTGYTSITVNPLPKPEILTNWSLSSLVNRICLSEEPKLLEGNSIENGYPYLDWRWDGRGIVALTGSQYKFSPQNAGLGEHSLTYTVTNIYGCIGVITENITVDGHAKLDFSYVRNGQTISFDGSDFNKTNYTWHFGDGDTSIERYPVHTYNQPGKYQVKVTSYDLAEENGNVCPDSSLTKEIEIYPLGIDENRDDLSLTYNRTERVIQINLTDIDFERFTIIDLNGKMVLTGSLHNDNSIETGNLKPSVYIVSIASKSGLTYQAKINLN